MVQKPCQQNVTVEYRKTSIKAVNKMNVESDSNATKLDNGLS